MNSYPDQTNPIDAKAFKKRAQVLAAEMGFGLFGVTNPNPPNHLNVYEDWLRQDRHGTMNYLASERALQGRKDPELILEGCASILVLGTNYLPPSPHAADEYSQARVAAYALGDDYHETLLDRMEKLIEALEDEFGGPIRNKTYTDTGPILERELAQRAGLGWIGKNTCLIHPRKGSYFLLGEIFLDIPLAPDEPITVDHCGSCTRCIEACPTYCILSDRTLDASRCISYLNIEHRGEISVDLRLSMEDWVFGCDICQQVCPWNIRFSEETHDSTFEPRPFLNSPSPSNFLSLEQEEYQEVFKRSPLKRAKRNGLLRNAAIVAANQTDGESVSHLVKILFKGDEGWLRSQAAWSLGQIGGEDAVKGLQEGLAREAEPPVRREIHAALDRLHGGG